MVYEYNPRVVEKYQLIVFTSTEVLYSFFIQFFYSIPLYLRFFILEHICFENFRKKRFSILTGLASNSYRKRMSRFGLITSCTYWVHPLLLPKFLAFTIYRFLGDIRTYAQQGNFNTGHGV